MNLRQLTITNLWPNIKSDQTLIIRDSLASQWTTITIDKGNYTLSEITSYLHSQFQAIPNNPPFTIQFGVTLSKDNRFIFSSSVDIRDDTTCLDLLGIPQNYFTNFLPITESIIPVKLYGPTDLSVNSSLSLYTIPPSQRLCKVPVSAAFGDVMHYFDESGSQPNLCSEHHIQRLQIHIQDSNNQEIEGYEEFPWTLVLSLEAIPNPGFTSAERIDRPTEEEGNIIIE